MTAPDPPLKGLRVLDLTLVWSGPYATMILGDMGAEIIRVESHHRWQPSTRGHRARPSKAFVAGQYYLGRGYPDMEPGERPWNRHAMFNCHARNKLAMTLDIARPSGVRVLKNLAAVCDVVVENNAPGTLDKLGIGYRSLRKIRPDILFISASGMGAWGPQHQHRGFGQHFEALCGHTWLRGYPDEDPSHTTMAMPSDGAAGMSIVVAVLMALHQRLETGQGQYIDLSLVESFLPYLAPAFLEAALHGRDPARPGNRHPLFAPQGVYPCKENDTWVALSVQSDAEWSSLAEVMGRPEIAGDERFATVLGRLKHHDDLDTLISAWTAKRSATEAMTMLQAQGVRAGAVLDEADAYGDPHLRARRFWVELEQADTGSHLYPGLVWRMGETPGAVRLPPCRLGEHNAYVYRELLACAEENYSYLEREGHLGTEYDSDVP